MANEGCAQLKVLIQKYIICFYDRKCWLAWLQNKILFWVIISWAWETVTSFQREFSYCSCPGSSWDGVFFFIVAGVTLCYGFRRTVLIKHWCCSCCWAVLYRAKDVSASCTALPSRMLRKAQVAGRGQNQDNWPKLTKGTFHTIWHPAELLKWRRLAGVLLLFWNW